MKKPKSKYILILLLITNIITLFLYLSQPGNYTLVLSMSGKSDNWMVSDYQIEYFSDKGFYADWNEIVTYLGDKSNIQYYEITMNSLFGQGGTSGENLPEDNQIVLSSSSTIKSTPLNILVKDYLKQIIDNTTMIIFWQENDGSKHSEIITLRINSTLPIDKYQK